MTDIETHLHALPSELAPLLQQCVADLSLYVAQVNFPPYNVREIDGGRVGAIVVDDPQCTNLVFSTAPFVALGKDQGEFSRGNPNTLNLELGRLAPEGLRESYLLARCFDTGALAAWKRIVKEVKAITRAGADITGGTGVAGHDRNHRFTKGAKQLEMEGVPILTINRLRVQLTGNG